MKIGLSHINGTNHGDQIIYYTAKHLVEKSIEENQMKDVELISLDISQVYALGVEKERNARKRGIKAKLERKRKARAMQSISRKIAAEKKEDRKRELILQRWHMTDLYRLLSQNEYPLVETLDLMFFTGGGIIKYHQQQFHLILHDIIEICERNNIPVLINAAGVEGYDEKDVECRILKEALNKSCVKYVSTRDDYETLKNCFMTNPDIETELVCDPAFYTGERYRIRKPETTEKLIGINAIRPAIFKDYLYAVNQDELAELYYDLTLRLIDEGYTVEFFTNGVESDARIFKILFKQYPELAEYRDAGKIRLYIPTQPRKLIKRLTQYERFLAVRLHASIVGTSLGVPNVSLVWCVKQLLFGEQTGTSDNFITKKGFKASNVYKKLMQAQPYEVDAAYKNTIYDAVNRNLKKYYTGE